MAGPGPREDYLQDEHYFMSVAVLTAKRSRDPGSGVGACIEKDGNIISVGYNHMPMGDGEHDWARKGPDNKFLYVNHAILNARGADLRGATVYVTLFPSNKCAMEIIIAGIEKVCYIDDKYFDRPWCKASKKMLNKMHITCVQVPAYDIDITMPKTDGLDP